MLGSSAEESTQETARWSPASSAACCKAFTTLTYASGLPMYFPTRAILTSCWQASALSAITCQSPSRQLPALGDTASVAKDRVGAILQQGPCWAAKPKRSQMTRPVCCSSRSRGTRYKFETSCNEMTHSEGTWQKSESFFCTAASTGFSERHMSKSGLRPASRRSFTECWHGFVFCSPVAPTSGSMPKWIIMKFPRPTRKLSCWSASK
mmetsp:Transcript_127564/g.397225  ORF Transcript_127564/g.397225 Transcript_127564/m.397225 type:complete len:208 (-) Transcript_127564:645-1268(-)